MSYGIEKERFSRFFMIPPPLPLCNPNPSFFEPCQKTLRPIAVSVLPGLALGQKRVFSVGRGVLKKRLFEISLRFHTPKGGRNGEPVNRPRRTLAKDISLNQVCS